MWAHPTYRSTVTKYVIIIIIIIIIISMIRFSRLGVGRKADVFAL
jgi:hypothetical protein